MTSSESNMTRKFDEAHVIYRYKYLPFTEGSLKTISEGTIKFACPLEFNDPFDCLPYYDTTNLSNIHKIRPDLFRAAGNRRGLSPAQRIQRKEEFVARLRNRIEDGTFANDRLRRVGVLSLSKNPLNILMWSHYAAYHQGFVLEFRIPIMGRSEDIIHITDRLLPFPVNYLPDRPRIVVSQFETEDLVRKVLLTKSDLWKYEEEERVISEDRPPGIFPYRRDDILCSVVAGIRISDANFEMLTSICNEAKRCNPGLSLYKAESLKDNYAIHVPGHPRLSLGADF